LRNLLGDKTRRQEELYQLKKASLLEQAAEVDHTSGLSYTMHDLICFLIQSLGVAPDTELTWFTLASDIIYAVMTEELDQESEQFMLNRAMCIPHITALARLDVLERYRVLQFAYICHLAGDYFYDTYEAAEAVNMYNIAVSDRERACEEGLEPDEYNLLLSLESLGNAEHELDNYEAAQKSYYRVLTGMTAIMGPDAHATLRVRTNIAMLAVSQALYAVAEEQYNFVIQSMGNATENETELSYAKEGLAVVYRMQGLHVKSAEYLEQVRDMQKRDQSLNEHHPKVIQSQQNLAIAYFDLGRYTEAESLLVSILERCREKYDDTHEITRTVAMNLAMVWVDQGRLEDAEGMALRAIDPATTGFDPVKECTRSNRPYLIDALEILARTHEDLHKNAEAEAEYSVVLQSRESVLRPDHPLIFRTKDSLTRVYGDSEPESASRAFAVFEEVLEKHTKKLGREHPKTLLTLQNYGSFLARQRGYGEKARLVLEEAFEGRKRVLGPDHPLTLVSKASLAGIDVVGNGEV
jgi:tetratricopeptide (TPR) repeat protein